MILKNCICNQYRDKDRVSIREKYWSAVGNVYIGTLLKCNYCGALWIYTIGGHGEGVYIKTDKVEAPWDKEMAPSTAKEINAEIWTEEQKNIWEKLVADLEAANEEIIREKQMPEVI